MYDKQDEMLLIVHGFSSKKCFDVNDAQHEDFLQ